MKQTLLTVAIISVISFVMPAHVYATWWNPSSWHLNRQQAGVQKESQNIPSDIPGDGSKSFNVKTNEDLKAEISTLKSSLDDLYKAHNRLVDDHNSLLKYVDSIVSPSSNLTVDTNHILGSKVADLEKSLNYVCGKIFSHPLSFNGKCPAPGGITGKILEDRIKKLEGGY